MRAPVACVPLVASVPDHPPEAVQAVALVEAQVRVEPLPLLTVLGLALKVTVGAGEVTVTVADWLPVPPVPEQVRTYVVFAVRAPVDCEPLTAFAPDQPPEAVQAVALVEDQFNVAAAPLFTVVGFSVRLTPGAVAVTDTMVVCVALPPVPVQVSAKLVLAVNAPVDCEPLIAFAPDQPPEAVQEVALVDDQVSVALPPLATVLGVALKVTTAVGFALTVTEADWVALPPAPVQVNVKLELAVSAPLDWVPLTALLPDQAPPAVQAVAFAADQDKVAALPLMTELGLAASVMLGVGALTETVADCEALPPAPVQVNV